jgi:hypothetical protein
MRPPMADVQQGEPMLEKYFSAPKTLRRLPGGISGPHIDAFAETSNVTDTPLVPLKNFEMPERSGIILLS